MEKICKTCGKTFTTYEPNSKFCSSECYNANRKQKVQVTCAECGKKEFVVPSRAKKYKCCSTECLGKFNSKRYNQQITLTCPICGKEYNCKQSALKHHRTCGESACRKEWLKINRQGEKNNNYRQIEVDVKSNSITHNMHDKSKTIYQHVVKKVLGLKSTAKLPKGYVIHHKDANHMNNNPDNLVVLPKTAHRLVHTNFGNVLIRTLHTKKISKEDFFNCCNDEEKEFYKHIIDLNITHQAVVKQGELLGRPEEGNQQPSIYRNIIEGSTSNERDLARNGEVGNFDTSALPDNIGGDVL